MGFDLQCLGRSCRRMLEERPLQPRGERTELQCRARNSLLLRLIPDLQLCPFLSHCGVFFPSSSSVCGFLFQIILPASKQGNFSLPLCLCCPVLRWRGDGSHLSLSPVFVLSIFLLAPSIIAAPTERGFPCAESVSLPTQHLTR